MYFQITEERGIHMKMMKRIAALVLAVCLITPFMPQIVQAAEGRIMFSDPETRVGDTVSIKGVIRTAGEPIGDADITMTYDSESLEFIEGDGVTLSEAGSISYSGGGEGSETELVFMMDFRVLKTGESILDIVDYTAYLYSDERLNCEKGSSRITAKEGPNGEKSVEPEGTGNGGEKSDNPPAPNTKIDIGGKRYIMSTEFTDSEIPKGFSKQTIDYKGESVTGAKQNNGDRELLYLVGSDRVGMFFFYDGTEFTPCLPIAISEETTIYPLENDGTVELPETYKETTLDIQEFIFPTWQDTESDGLYIIYAANSSGKDSLYQYDREEGTYQKFVAPEVEEKEEEKEATGIEKVLEIFKENIEKVLIVAGIIAFILFVIITILAVKLRHRNLELDDLYDEYHIDEEPPIVKTKAVKKDRSQFKRPVEEPVEEPKEEPLFEEDYEGGFEEDYPEDEEYPEEEEYLDEQEELFDEDAYFDDDEEDAYDEELYDGGIYEEADDEAYETMYEDDFADDELEIDDEEFDFDEEDSRNKTDTYDFDFIELD